jgi:hypothetical protein
MHSFGIEYWIRIPKEGRLKNNLTTAKAVTARLLHPSMTGAGYSVVTQGNNTIMSSKDVVFKRPKGAKSDNTTPKATDENAFQVHTDPEGLGEHEVMDNDEQQQNQRPREATPHLSDNPVKDYREPTP